jgi:hypothetical protein
VKRRSIEFVEEDRHLAANVRLGFAVTTLMILVLALLLVRWFWQYARSGDEMTITAALLKWSPVRLALRARVATIEIARQSESDNRTPATAVVESPPRDPSAARQESSEMLAANRPALGLEQIAEELDRINTRLLRAEDIAHQWRRRGSSNWAGSSGKTLFTLPYRETISHS